jgi:hypothetical protein
MKPELQNLLDTKAKEIIDRMKANLQKRGLVGQTLLIKEITYQLKENNGLVELVFIFDRQKNSFFKDKTDNKFKIRDPLFGVKKEYAFTNRERLAFTRKANIFTNLRDKYFDEIIDEVTQQKLDEMGIRISAEIFD